MSHSVFLLDDEALILLDLEFAAEDRGCITITATDCDEALEAISNHPRIDFAILDVSLGPDETCEPVARALELRRIPFILHSGELNRLDELVASIDAPLVPKPAAAADVIATAIALFEERSGDGVAEAAQ